MMAFGEPSLGNIAWSPPYWEETSSKIPHWDLCEERSGVFFAPTMSCDTGTTLSGRREERPLCAAHLLNDLPTQTPFGLEYPPNKSMVAGILMGRVRLFTET